MSSLAVHVTAPAGVSVSDVELVRKLYEFMRNDPVLIQHMNASNETSVALGHVFHGMPHALEVADSVHWLFNEINKYRPGTISEYDLLIAAMIALVHDVGRAKATNRDELKHHHTYGAKIANQYLIDAAQRAGVVLTEQTRKNVVLGVIHHGAEPYIHGIAGRKLDIQTAWNGMHLVSDKFAGSEVRVPPEKLELMHYLAGLPVGNLRKRFGLDDDWTLGRLILNCEEVPACIRTPCDAMLYQAAKEQLESLGLSWPKLRCDGHDHVNGAIKARNRQIVPYGEPDRGYWGEFFYGLQVDDSIANQKLVTGLDWWNAAFQVAALALKFFGLRLLLVYNGEALMYNKAVGDWVSAPKFRRS